MYITSEFETETFAGLKAKYVNYYAESFINEKDVKYIAYHPDVDTEVELSSDQVNDFINDVNEAIEINREED